MGMFEALVMREGDLVPLNDVITELGISHDDAIEFLRRVNYPVFREGELITRTQYRILVKELARYKDFLVPNTECHNGVSSPSLMAKLRKNLKHNQFCAKKLS